MKQLIQVDKEVFLALVEEVVAQIREKDQRTEPRWIDGKEVMEILKIKSKSTLQILRDEGKIRFSQPGKTVLYDRESVMAYIEAHVREPFK